MSMHRDPSSRAERAARWRRDEAAHALHEGLLGAGRDEQDAQARRRAPRQARAPARAARRPPTGCRWRRGRRRGWRCRRRRALDRAAIAVPAAARRARRWPRRAPRAPGRRRRADMIGGDGPASRTSAGNASADQRRQRRAKIRPPCAASWWATKTSVRSASAVAGLGDDVERRALGEAGGGTTWRPPLDVVEIPAAASAPTQRARRRRAERRRPAAAAAAVSTPSGGQ